MLRGSVSNMPIGYIGTRRFQQRIYNKSFVSFNFGSGYIRGIKKGLRAFSSVPTMPAPPPPPQRLVVVRQTSRSTPKTSNRAHARKYEFVTCRCCFHLTCRYCFHLISAHVGNRIVSSVKLKENKVYQIFLPCIRAGKKLCHFF